MQIFVYFSFKRKGPLTAISSAPPCTLRIKFKFLCKFKIYKEGTQINDIKSSTRIITPPSMYYQQCYHKYVLSKVVLSSQVCIIQGSIIITSMYYPRQYYYHKYVLSKVVLLSHVYIFQGSLITKRLTSNHVFCKNDLVFNLYQLKRNLENVNILPSVLNLISKINKNKTFFKLTRVTILQTRF